MAFEPLVFSKTWKKPEDFPAYEPNEEQVRADLQLLHDETKDGLNRLIEALNDSSAAENLPFAPAEGLSAETVQAAIEEVYEAVKSAAAALIVNGSVTKEKLEAELLKRIYGGKIWVAYREPGEGDNPNTDFPVGQLWLHPQVALDNLLQQQWQVSGGTVEEGDGWEFTTDGTQDYLTATQVLEEVGTAKQTVLVCVKMGECSSTLQELSLVLNGEVHEPEDGVTETELDQTGSLEISFHGQWASAQEGEQICVQVLAVVLPDADQKEIVKQRLQELGNFEQVSFPMAVYLQTQPGVWEKVITPVQGVSRGGTGLARVEAGALLCGTDTDNLTALAPEENGILQTLQGAPKWVKPEELAQNAGYLRTMQGTYQGDETERTFTLPVAPTVLFITADDGQETACLFDGSKSGGEFQTIKGNLIVNYWAYLQMEGNTLTYTVAPFGVAAETMYAKHMNRKDMGYRWTALY